MNCRTDASLAMLAGLAFSLPVAPAAGDITQAAFISPTQFVYNIVHVPDFDQRRAGLPLNGGSYCVPTSFLNWAGYIAAHGNPTLLPGEDWYVPSNYNAVTVSDLGLGFLMNTGADSGTNVPDAVAGGQAWLSGLGLVVYFDRATIGDQTLAEMAQIGMNGGLVMPRVAWLADAGNNVYVRAGGHLTCMAYAAKSGADAEIGIRDPGSNENPNNLNAESVKTTDFYPLVDELIIYEGLPRLLPRMVGYGNDTVDGFIVGFLVIVPTTVIVPQPTSISVLSSSLVQSLGGLTEDQHELLIPNSSLISQGVSVGRSPYDIAYVAQPLDMSPPSLVYWNDLLGQEFVLGTVPNLEGVAGSRTNTFYALAGRTLACYDPFEPAGNYLTASLIVPDTTTAITYDDATDKVVLLEPGVGQLLCYDRSLPAGVPPTVVSIPNGVPTAPESELHAMPGTPGVSGGYLLVTPGDTQAWLLMTDPTTGRLTATPVAPPGNTDPIQSATPTPGGIAFSIEGRLTELTQDDKGNWIPAENSVLTGAETNGFPIIAPVSRTDIDYDDALNPNRADLLPTRMDPIRVLGDCRADTNFDGQLTPADFNAWIILFNNDDLNADQNLDGLITPADFNAWILNYNAGCD